MSHWEDEEKQSNKERAAEIKARREKNPDHYKKISPSKTKQLNNYGKYISQNESRGHKILDTWFKNRQAQQNAEIPTAAQRKNYDDAKDTVKKPVKEEEDLSYCVKKDTDDKDDKKKTSKKVNSTPATQANMQKEAVDKEHPIYKEYQSLKKHDIKTLRGMIKQQHRIIDTSEFRTKEHAISHILNNKHGNKRVMAALGEETISEQQKTKPYTMASKKPARHSETVHDAIDTNHRQMNNLVHNREGGVHASEKTFRKEETDMDLSFMQMVESWETEKKKRHLRDALDRHTEKALAANKAGDDEAVRVHQQHMNRIKGQMAKLMRNESVDNIYDATENQLDEISKATLSSYVKKAKPEIAAHGQDADYAKTIGDRENAADSRRKEFNRERGVNVARAKLGRKHDSSFYAGNIKVKANEEVELEEAWSVNGRNPQRSVKVGSKVRSYDFPGMHDDHYVEGHVVGETPSSYHIKVGKVVRGGKEIPTPSHMGHVEAPKGKSIWTDAYAVHKIHDHKAEQIANPVEEPKGGAKTFSKVYGSRVRKGQK